MRRGVLGLGILEVAQVLDVLAEGFLAWLGRLCRKTGVSALQSCELWRALWLDQHRAGTRRVLGLLEHRKPGTCFPCHAENCPVFSLLRGLDSWKVPRVGAFGYSEGPIEARYSFLDEVGN